VKPKSAIVALSDSLTLSCDVNGKGFDGTRVSWLHNGNVVASETLPDELPRVTINYTINTATYGHNGTYVCKVSSDIGDGRSDAVSVNVVDREPCMSSPCRHNGSCVYDVSGFGCVCPEGYTGNACEKTTVSCSSGPCFNDKCLDGFSGIDCGTYSIIVIIYIRFKFSM
jgi:beta-glucanase (GH16 family)